MDIIKIVILGIVAIIINTILKPLDSKWTVIITITFAVLVLGYVLGYIKAIINFIEGFSEQYNIKPLYINTLMKVLGIALIAEIGANLSKDAGEEGISQYILMAGKILIIFISLPILKAVIDLIASIPM